MTSRKRNSLARIQRNADELVNSLTFRIGTARMDDMPTIQVELRKARWFRDLTLAVLATGIPDRNGAGSRSVELLIARKGHTPSTVQFQADRDVDDAGNPVLCYTYATRLQGSFIWHWPLVSRNAVRTWRTLDGARRYFLRRQAEFNGLLDVVEG